ncbi:polyprenyl synthetase family protein [Nocardia otitidiscaviarum]|uniref:polyprenyl synthetase family protein n=1 Tax=Nocardia otitidiscaviarum TaxID=1823 RepID=UPI002453CC09|nr:polyprenyl synthetase family protein [Nocardia otitidiscaviarum]
MARYHFGWTDADGRPCRAPSGKTLRGALTLASAAASPRSDSDSTVRAVPAAVAVELVHNFSLIHDDVMDGDSVRRGRPTVWRVWGAANAVLLGDALLASAMSILASAGDTVAERAISRLADATIALCGGQHDDCAFEGSIVVGTADYLAMARDKTGALMGCACALGALYAGGDAAAVTRMDVIGRDLGLAFQLIDDVIGLTGDPEVTGKPVGGDLARRKKTYPVLSALQAEGAAAQRITDLYVGSLPLTSVEIAELRSLIEELGGIESAARLADERVATVIDELSRMGRTTDLKTLARLIAHRDR